MFFEISRFFISLINQIRNPTSSPQELEGKPIPIYSIRGQLVHILMAQGIRRHQLEQLEQYEEEPSTQESLGSSHLILHPKQVCNC